MAPLFSASTAPSAPSAAPIEHHYGPATSQVADLYLPNPALKPPRRTAVALLHGGFWKTPYGREQLVPIALDLCRRGHVVWNIGYRRVGEPGGGWPGTLHDVLEALALLRRLSQRGQAPLDADRIALVGHSAGGHLALAATSKRTHQPARVRAVVALAAVTDLKAAHDEGVGGANVAAFLGGLPSSHPQHWADASPITLLPHGGQHVLLHGTDDEDVPLSQSTRYVAAARAVGEDVNCIELPGTDHMAFLDPQSAAHARLCQQLDMLLASSAPSSPATGHAPNPRPET